MAPAVMAPAMAVMVLATAPGMALATVPATAVMALATVPAMAIMALATAPAVMALAMVVMVLATAPAVMALAMVVMVLAMAPAVTALAMVVMVLGSDIRNKISYQIEKTSWFLRHISFGNTKIVINSCKAAQSRTYINIWARRVPMGEIPA